MGKTIVLIVTVSIAALLMASCPTDPPEPSLQQVMFFSSNWGEDSIRITDDITSLTDGATAVPRIITGASTTIQDPMLDSLAVDQTRKFVYLTNNAIGNVLVFGNPSSASGDVAPVRSFSVAGENIDQGIAVDAARDRLYVSGAAGHIWIFGSASTLNGAVTPDAILAKNVLGLCLDETNDRLYASSKSGADFSIYIYNSASTLTTGAVPDRTVVFPANFNPMALWVDPEHNRLYVGSNTATADGHRLVVFDNADSLSGACDPDTQATAYADDWEVLGCVVDQHDTLYTVEDSATKVRMIAHASTLSGLITSADKTISGVVNSGYGMDYLAY
jgi:hypothetical protein